MSAKLSNIATLFLLSALGIFLALPTDQSWVRPVFWGLSLVLIVHLTLAVRRQRRRARQAARWAANPHHFMVNTVCHLNWDRLSGNFDEATRRLLEGLVNRGWQDGRAIRPSLEKAFPRLRRQARRSFNDPGPAAYTSWCLILLSRITGKDGASETGLELPETKWWNMGSDMHNLAAQVDPDEASVLADWARVLEDQALVLAESEGAPAYFLSQALAKYERATELDPDLAPAWRGRGRVLSRIGAEADLEEALPVLSLAVEYFETARQGREWDGEFYDEFGLAVLRLAERHPTKAVHYFRYAAKLFTLASEIKENDQGSLFLAGKALHQAGAASEGHSPEAAAELHQEALAFFREAGQADPEDPWNLLWSARGLLSLYNLAARVGGGEAELLNQADQLCRQAAELAPVEEVYSEWANILSVKAENGGTQAGELWAATARKYGQAAACDEVAADRAAVNWHNWAYALASEAEISPSPARRRKLLKDAARKYEQAARLNGDNLITLKNWGDVLGDLAELTDNQTEAAAINDEAMEKFRRATERYPDKAGPWRRWSAILQGQARAEQEPAKRRALWQEALAKLEQGARVEPDDPATWVLWGRVLSELYWEGPEYERPLILSAIIEKYEKALSLDRSDDETWNLLGRAHLEATDLPEDLATTSGTPLSNALAAAEHLRTACQIRPDAAGHWAEWGRALFKVAQIVDNEASGLSALKEAHEKYETASALEPAEGEHHTGLGHILYQWGWRLEEPEPRRDKFQQAYHHCAEAGRLAPHDPVVWRNWGKVAEALANMENDPRKSFDWQSEADEKYYHADTLDPPLTKDRRH